MKSRSHRLPITDPHDDWVDGSWTVDCVCGVNFDDGEEMVNCDECGVWVHTRCSRYVKSEKLFACDKCKSKNSRNDSEETEVAQLLVELPTKTLRMDNPYPSNCPPRRPFRLWTDLPMEERVHVQGIPGGNPSLFGGLSSVFSPELWKCTGYVPKKFNFQYSEFPCWDEKLDVDRKSAEENGNPVDKGAGVLFSLSKENALHTPVATLSCMEKQVDEDGSNWLAHSHDMQRRDCEDVDVRQPQNDVKKDRSLLHPIVVHYGKRKKEDLGTAKDRSGKKKARTGDREADSKKKAAHAPNLYPQNQLMQNDWNFVKSELLRNNLAFAEEPSEALSSDVGRYNSSNEARPKEDRVEHQVPVRIEGFPKTDDFVASSLDHNGSAAIKEEVVGNALDNMNDKGEVSRSSGLDLQKTEHLVEDQATTAPKGKENHYLQEINVEMSPSSLQPEVKVKAEVELDNTTGVSIVTLSPPNDVKLDGVNPLAQHVGISADQLSENSKMDDDATASLQFSVHKVQDTDRFMAKVGDSQADGADASVNDPYQAICHLSGAESSMAVWKSSSELKYGLRPAEETLKSGSTVLCPPAKSSPIKMVVSMGKSSPTLSANLISKSSVSDRRRPVSVQNHNSSAKQQGTYDGSVSSKKDNALNDLVRDGDSCERAKKNVTEYSKTSVSSIPKTAHSIKFSHASVSKKTLSDSKHPLVSSSSKTSSAQNIAAAPDYRELGCSSQTDSASHVQNKSTASNLPHRGEKTNQLNCQPSSKMNHAAPMHPPAPSNSPATLSDEELALLLHQELNSSPRVPRVPRMRQAGSLPQLTSPTATSMLMKRTSSSGAKDHGLVPRRKSKDLAKDGPRSYRDPDDEAKKLDRVASSLDQRKHDSACSAGAVTKRETDYGPPKEVHSVMKSIPPASTASSGPSSSTEVNEQNLSSTRNSPQNASDDDVDTVGRHAHRTLPGCCLSELFNLLDIMFQSFPEMVPTLKYYFGRCVFLQACLFICLIIGLLAEIMGKGKRMTYEELCNAVLPHWPHLRKHNGERYAYSSHSQAVLDCLRNRNEWARLVDRGPKTNASKKRRKVDADQSSFESEENQHSKDRAGNDGEGKGFGSHREEFPKGKRKARKRRRLALPGRGVKDVRRRRKEDFLSDDDVGSFSNSSEESMFSEDEVQGGGTCPVGSEASASSDEKDSML
ncbi:unnamed protein product [Ilex paraguariensis]|uniref:Zinc finger PHD-type domain-containing protein n=1 Tax=Ilex paraguariensis TaxID=185542 RepID=A0ABC8TLJ6_9AQUA